LNGFTTYFFIPDFIICSIASLPLLAVIAMIGVEDFSGLKLRICSVAAMPLSSGSSSRFWQGPNPENPEGWPYERDWLEFVKRDGA